MLGNADLQYDKFFQKKKTIFHLSCVPQNLNLLPDQIIFQEHAFLSDVPSPLRRRELP